MFVKEACSEGDQGCGTHRVASYVEALNGILDDERPTSREEYESGDNKNREDDKKNEVQEEENIGEHSKGR